MAIGMLEAINKFKTFYSLLVKKLSENGKSTGKRQGILS